ncbi:VOC family protein [Lutibaculum baratangense]|uniref:Putative hydroxylase n=1 Tax=Lutibaculum baratangense AMV1 TaxID=631454 RepID=V4TJA8_9HYPH|nr:VOC family protein [Lutibaculum baratangense]ESR26008.1 putative hydroxylase [Lutibaculum baratangense AMV1]
MSDPTGTFVWYELMTSDPAAALAFYGSVVGWTTSGMPMPGKPDETYTMLHAGDRPVAGLMALPEDVASQGGRPGWIGYVVVEDVDRAAEKLAAAGGTVHRQPADIPGVGRFAVVADPAGAVFCPFRGAPEMSEGPAPAPMGTPGHVGWHELMGGEVDDSLAFYGGLLGWTKEHDMDMGPMGAYRLFAGPDGQMIGGMMRRPSEVPQSFWLYYFNVPAMDAAIEKVKAGGGQVINGPMEVPGGSTIIQALDPQGAMFALVAPPAQGSGAQ